MNVHACYQSLYQLTSSGIPGIAGIAINSSGYVYVADYNTVLTFDSTGKFVRKWVAVDNTNSWVDIMMGKPVASITGICLGPDDIVYVTCNIGMNGFFSDDPSRIRVFTPDGDRLSYQISSWGAMDALIRFGEILLDDGSINEGTLDALLNSIVYDGIAVNSTDIIYTTIPANNSILIYNLSGNLIGALNGTNTGAGAFSQPTDIAINSSDCIFVLDSGNNRTVVLDRDNRFIMQFGTAGTGDGQFCNPQGLGIASSGNKLAIADMGNNRAQTFEYFGRYYDQVQVTVDNTPPVITGAPVTAANANGWYGAPVTVHFSASDATSGVQSCTGDQVLSGEGAGQSVTGTAVDRAGNVNSTTVSGINIDKSSPLIDGTPLTAANANGWYNGPVTVHFNASDALSGLHSCTGDQVLSGEAANQSVMGTAVDRAGNTNITTVGINIDRTAPVISCSLSGDLTGDGRLGQDVKATLGTNDSLSGVDSVKYSFDNVLWITYGGTFSIPFGDSRTLYYVVTDKAGNSASGSSNLNFAPDSYFGSGGTTPTPMPSPSLSPTPMITPTPVATPVNGSAPSPAAPGGAVSLSPVGTDMLPAIILVVVVVALLQSRRK
jgi:hypothetical protein